MSVRRVLRIHLILDVICEIITRRLMFVKK